jgi:hypothetical protein
MGENGAPKYYQYPSYPSMDVVSAELGQPQGGSKCYDDDGRLKRTGAAIFLSFFELLI